MTNILWTGERKAERRSPVVYLVGALFVVAILTAIVVGTLLHAIHPGVAP